MGKAISMRSFEKAFSKERMNSYKDEKEYIDNLRLVQKIAPILQILEVFIRNKVDDQMRMKDGEEWLLKHIDKQYSLDLCSLFQENEQNTQNSLSAEGYKTFFKDIKIRDKSILEIKQKNNVEQDFQRVLSCLLISRLSFGFWYLVIKNENFSIFDFNQPFDFEKYNGAFRQEVKPMIANALRNNNFKTRVLINLLTSLRNRAFHAENLLEGKKRRKHSASVKTPFYYEDKKGNKRSIHIVLGIKTGLVEDFLNNCIDLCGLKNIVEDLKKRQATL